MTETKRQHRSFAAAAVLALALVLAAYANSFHNGFHFDDFHTVVDNPAVRSLHNIPRFFTDATSFSVLPANRTYRPVVSTSLAIDYSLGHGYVPLWFHVGTFLVFLLQLVAMYFLFVAIGRRLVEVDKARWIALAAAAWYGVHPAMAETVNYIIQRGDLYATCGVVAGLALFAARPRWRKSGLYLLPFVVAMLSKPPAIVFPVLLFVYAGMFEEAETKRWWRAAIAAAPALAVGVALLVLQSAMTPKSFAPSSISNADYILTQPFVLARYFGSMLLPLHLNVDSDLGAFDHLNLAAIGGIAFLLVLVAAIVFTIRRRALHAIAFGLLWFLICSLPTSVYRLSEVENDHRMFMPFVGLLFAAVWAVYCGYAAVAERLGSGSRRVLVAVACLALSVYAFGTHVRNEVWRTEESLWLDDTIKSPHNGRGLMIYGLTQMSKGEYPAALASFQRALAYTPNYDTLEINLGVVYGAMGNAAAAEQHFQRAIALAPSDDQAHFYFARFLLGALRLPEALREAQTAVALNGARVESRDLLASSEQMNGDFAAAQDTARETLALAPEDVLAKQLLQQPAPGASATTWINVSLARFQQHDFAGCIEAAQKALAIDPRSSLAYNNIGAAYAGLGQWDKAVDAEAHALSIDPTMQLAKNNLAAYSAAGKAKAAGPAATADELLNQSLAAYQAKQFAASIALARRALQLRPGYAEAWNNIAAGEAAQAHWDAAIAAANRAVALKPDFQLARNNLAWAQAEKAKAAAR